MGLSSQSLHPHRGNAADQPFLQEPAFVESFACFLLPCREAFRILVPLPGIERKPCGVITTGPPVSS